MAMHYAPRASVRAGGALQIILLAVAVAVAFAGHRDGSRPEVPRREKAEADPTCWWARL
jgi:hypothetical protein